MTAEEQKCAELLMRARSDFLTFMRITWQGGTPYIVGRHTRAICDRLTRAVDDYIAGKTTFLLCNIPFRHGKSTIISQYFPAWFLGRCSSMPHAVIMSGYGAQLVTGFSRVCKAIMRSPEYRLIFPAAQIDPGHDAVDDWALTGSADPVTVVGLGGSLTGRGGNLIVLDDAVKNREEAYSETYREKTWQSFSADLMTRRNAPASIVVVLMTQWHLDDIAGRILYAMEHDPTFPRFERLVFPARKDGPDGWDYLFPEQFPPAWYDEQRATLGPTMAAALLDCDPVGEGNRMFNPAWFNTYAKAPPADEMNIYLIIDSANAKRKESDFTSMEVWGLHHDRNYYLLDAVHDRLDLAGRTDALFALVERWRPKMTFWEQVGAMSDVQHVRLEMDNRTFHFPIAELKQSVPKQDRIGWLVPLYEAGRVWMPHKLLRQREDGVNYDFVLDFQTDEFLTYPASRHDDMIDCAANLQHPTFLSIARFPEKPVQDNAGRRPKTTAGAWRPF
jgi:predicted phage terminase large subunit-like protein